MKSKLDDIILIDKILLGDQTACRDLVERHKEYAFTIAYRILRNRENAEEAAQDAFIQAFRNLESFNKESKFTTWFYRIIFNAALMLKRKQKDQIEDIETVHTLAAEQTDNDFTKRREQQYYIEKALAHLSSEDAGIITLFYLKEQSLEEIAEITGMTASNAKVRLHRARQRLALELDSLLKREAKSLL
ncbi:sigma-70 family RNA polymerase sigma factor [Cytophagaceae bacterium YF14B1]|uniref:Sigma-70 family RNA polymerase sigma factor n=1 Tax=Xanthocytophaga flava TaxID=3048013 RepID=A0AAE3QN35_9BACT|nr:sigma-70 family RNA polymerase sigma factor [Xanthocytophaga flavus]MDJ1482085.1 sigma-70 family RNA polymerase sigma factor [Xanthocytophaga flavus]